MKRISKLTIYVIGCIAIFFFIARQYNAPETFVAQQTAHAFEWEKKVVVYFPKRADKECNVVYPQERMVPNAETLGPGAFQALLDGVIIAEESEGLVNSIPAGVLVHSFEIRDKVAHIDVSSEFSKGLQNACRKESLMTQINSTLERLPDIDRVVLTVEGEEVK